MNIFEKQGMVQTTFPKAGSKRKKIHLSPRQDVLGQSQQQFSQGHKKEICHL